MPDPVGNLLRIIPLLYPEGNGPSSLDHFGFSYLFPVAIPFDFQGCLAWFALLERIQLRCQFQGLCVNRVQSETNHLIPGDFGNGQRIHPFLLLPKGRYRKKPNGKREKEKPDEWGMNHET